MDANLETVNEDSRLLAPVGRDENLAAKVYRRLRGALMGGQLVSGQKLVHRLLAKELDVSPTPVRDALLRLVSEGALELDARGIAWVPHIAPDRYAEVMQLREELEGRAAARAAGLATPADIAELRAIQARLIEGRSSGNRQVILAEHERFHSRLLVMAQMPVLQRMVESLWMQAGPTLNLVVAMGPLNSPKGHPHTVLLDALDARDGPAARAAIVRDLREYGALVSQALVTASAGRSSAEKPRQLPAT